MGLEALHRIDHRLAEQTVELHGLAQCGKRYLQEVGRERAGFVQLCQMQHQLVRELATLMGVSPINVIKELMANGLMANGDRDGAADALLDIVRRDREWNDGAAKSQLLTIFEAVGLEDSWVAAQRRRLSQILFS